MDISVVIPVYNAERYVESAVESALQQKETAEVILVEDHSPDNALMICERLAESIPRVQLLRHSDGKNHGAGESRNLGIRAARSDYIAFLDADDYYLENCFSKAVDIFDNDPTVDGVYSAVGAEFESEEAKQRYYATHAEEIATVDEKVTPEKLFYYLVLGGAGYIHLEGLVVKKSGLMKVGLLPRLRLHQDSALLIKLAASLKLVAGDVQNPVAIRRLHLNNRITNLETNFYETRFKEYRYLFQWFQHEKLPEEKLRLVRNKFWRYSYRHYKNSGRYHIALYYYAASRIFGRSSKNQNNILTCM
jgi:glycosyltransferase involved in cell wall biosynthesis